jgi:hypothetical protein
MKYLKNFKSLFEDKESNILGTPSDSIDISFSPREKLNKINKNIQEYNQKKSKIDIAFKSKDANKIKSIQDEINKSNNDFLLNYLKVSKKKAQLEDLQKQLEDDNKSKIQSTDVMNSIQNKDDQKKYKDLINSIDSKITDKKLLIKKLFNEINIESQKIKKKMDSDKKEIDNLIKNVTNK